MTLSHADEDLKKIPFNQSSKPKTKSTVSARGLTKLLMVNKWSSATSARAGFTSRASKYQSLSLNKLNLKTVSIAIFVKLSNDRLREYPRGKR